MLMEGPDMSDEAGDALCVAPGWSLGLGTASTVLLALG